MIITDFQTMVSNWRLAVIEPKKKELHLFVSDRVKQIKQAQSAKYNEAQTAKAIKEQKFINSIIELNTEYELFMTHVDKKMNGIVNQYADYVNNGAELREQNRFLKERLEIMDKRELTYLELLTKRK
jgi:hypothetical protein